MEAKVMRPCVRGTAVEMLAVHEGRVEDLEACVEKIDEECTGERAAEDWPDDSRPGAGRCFICACPCSRWSSASCRSGARSAPRRRCDSPGRTGHNTSCRPKGATKKGDSTAKHQSTHLTVRLGADGADLAVDAAPVVALHHAVHLHRHLGAARVDVAQALRALQQLVQRRLALAAQLAHVAGARRLKRAGWEEEDKELSKLSPSYGYQGPAALTWPPVRARFGTGRGVQAARSPTSRVVPARSQVRRVSQPTSAALMRLFFATSQSKTNVRNRKHGLPSTKRANALR